MSEPETNPAPESAPASPVERLPTRIRWGGAKWIVGIFTGLFLLVFIGSKIADDDTFIGTAFTACCLFGGITLLVWWLIFSRAPWRIRLGAIAGVVVIASMFRLDGFSGNFMPTLVPRWKQTVKAERPAVEAAETKSDKAILPAEYIPTENDWPEFRGPRREGVVRGVKYSDAWLEAEMLWRIPIGEGWSSFCVVGPLAYTQWQEGEKEVTVCLEAASGLEVWRHADDTRFEETMGGPGPRATPTFANGRLFVLGATGILNCLDPNTGDVHWTVDILEDAKVGNIQWAMSGSPLVLGSRVIVSPGGADSSSLIAYDCSSGERIWGAGNAIASYSSPQLSRLKGVEQILIFHGEGVSAHEPDSGEPLWSYPFTTSPKICVAQPGIVDEASVLLSLGYGKGSILIDVEMMDGNWRATERWMSRRLKSKFNDFVIRDGHAYGIDEGILACIDLSTGERAWKGVRCGYGQLILVDETLVILSERGEVIFAKADPNDDVELGRFKAIDGKTWNHPVIANGLLLVRNASAAACFRLPGK